MDTEPPGLYDPKFPSRLFFGKGLNQCFHKDAHSAKQVIRTAEDNNPRGLLRRIPQYVGEIFVQGDKHKFLGNAMFVKLLVPYSP